MLELQEQRAAVGSKNFFSEPNAETLTFAGLKAIFSPFSVSSFTVKVTVHHPLKICGYCLEFSPEFNVGKRPILSQT